MKKLLLIGSVFISTNLSAQVVDTIAAKQANPNKNQMMVAKAKQSAWQAIKLRETRLVGTTIKPVETWLDSNQTLPETNNKVILYQFWNSTNPMCKAQMEAVQNLATQFKDSVQFEIVSITYEGKDEATKFLQNYSFSIPFYFSTKEKCNVIKQEAGYPTLIITDKKGIVQHMYCGNSTDPSVTNLFMQEKVYKEVLALIQKK